MNNEIKTSFFIIRLLFCVPDFNSLLLWCEMAFYYPSLCIKLRNQCHGLLLVLLAQAKYSSSILISNIVDVIVGYRHYYSAVCYVSNFHKLFLIQIHIMRLTAPAEQDNSLNRKMLHDAVLYFKALLCVHLNVILCTLSRSRCFHFPCKESIDTILF